ncbi:hypothetical protein C8255_16860 [filamentous cyanobacterium CCP3]|nr:hypothetical protein C8255_16860 [filamentous cyanobacterium CCP3]
MFTELSPTSSSQNEDFQDIDFDSILHQMNTGCFVDRIFPCEKLKTTIIEITTKIGTNCHNVAWELHNKSTLKISHGYLIVGSVPINFLYHPSWPYLVENKDSIELIDKLIDMKNIPEAIRQRKGASVMEIDQTHNQVIIKLLHHSVVVDTQGNYIECIYDRYPLACDEKNEIGYVFLPHESGRLGCSFEARSPMF